MVAKEAAARRAVAMVRDGTTLGLGSGSTVAFAIPALGERIANEKLDVVCIPTSLRSRDLAMQHGIPLTGFDTVRFIDMTIDGADEVDGDFHLIKGGGGALVREKIVAQASREVVIIVDESKMCETLGRYPLPVAVVPFGWETTAARIELLHAKPSLRMSSPSSDTPYVTDDGLYVLDLAMGDISDPARTELKLKQTVGVVEVGLFVGLASHIIVGHASGTVTEMKP